ncbi:hypothetical protein F2P56_034363 [Juglans regia]|uniref:Protein FAR1-RELATED SEQUENCE n=2 Tax=Juglans regia TaxID=51240 RepID=A0A833TQL6_JUGRE|nr:protein FAR1-RELATED SEQUENCE 1-like [Juglans regia]KAF5445302.1 hypothetical protein F2P56_034363 [Juglans regia]
MDQDRAMKNAISIVFPQTRPRYCLWHIMRKFPEKLASNAQHNSGLKSTLQRCVYDCQTVEEFEKHWGLFLDTYNLHDHAWLQSLYSERMHWVPVTTLKEFVDQFDNALRKKVENENAADFHSFNCTIPCISHLPFERIFQHVYTIAKFKEVQKEIMGMICCNAHLYKNEGAISTYHVDDKINTDDFVKLVAFSVYFNKDELEVKCSCGLFEMRGIMCRHALSVLDTQNVQTVPEKYILERWRKDIKQRYTLIKSSYNGLSENPETQRYDQIMRRCCEVAKNASTMEEHCIDMLKWLDIMDGDYLSSRLLTTPSRGNDPTDPTIVSSTKVLSPHVVRGKGRPPSKRRVPPI